MARFIPPVVHSGTKSEGEFQLFEALHRDPNTEHWIILHSYDLPHHEVRLQGEIDFIIIVPEWGILCLSVKHCFSASRINGLWYLGNLPPDAQGPFKRAHDDKFSLLAKLKPKFQEWGESCPLCHAVAFTAIPSSQVNWLAGAKEWEDFEEVYADEFSRNCSTVSRPLMRCIRGARAKLDAGGHVSLSRRTPTMELADKIAEFLRPDFEFFASPRLRAGHVQAELKRFLKDQMVCLDRIQEDQRVLFTGRAGTGKTLLAIEAVRREVGRSDTTIVLVVCYSDVLAEHLKAEMAPLGERVVVRSLREHIALLAGILEADSRSMPICELAELALSICLEKSPLEFDALVVDEGQDILRTTSLNLTDELELLDLSLKGGLTGGRWLIFMDDYQNIHAPANSRPFDIVGYCLDRGSYVAKADPLRTNCRNLPLVSEYAKVFSNMRPAYAAVRRPTDSVVPWIKYYTSQGEQQRLLQDVLAICLDPRQATSDAFTGRCRYELGEIVVLSASDREQCAEQLPSEWRSRMTRLEAAEPNRIRYGKIHAFKGLEAPVVIVTDIDQLDAEGTEEHNRAALLYVAITRSTERLALLAHDRVGSELIAQLAGGDPL